MCGPLTMEEIVLFCSFSLSNYIKISPKRKGKKLALGKDCNNVFAFANLEGHTYCIIISITYFCIRVYCPSDCFLFVVDSFLLNG